MANELYGRKRKEAWIFPKSTLKMRLTHGPKMHVFLVILLFKGFYKIFCATYNHVQCIKKVI